MCGSKTQSIINFYYYHFVGHCGAFCGLKWRIWRENLARLAARAKMSLSQAQNIFMPANINSIVIIITIIDIPSFWSYRVNLILPPDIFPTHLVVPLSVVLFPPLCNL